MVSFMEHPTKMDDMGVPLQETSACIYIYIITYLKYIYVYIIYMLYMVFILYILDHKHPGVDRILTCEKKTCLISGNISWNILNPFQDDPIHI